MPKGKGDSSKHSRLLENEGQLQSANYQSFSEAQESAPFTGNTDNTTSSAAGDDGLNTVSTTRTDYTLASEDMMTRSSAAQPTGPVDPLEQKHKKLNKMFGMTPWKSHVSRRPLSKRSDSVQLLYTDLKQPTPAGVDVDDVTVSFAAKRDRHLSAGNIAWAVFFGWWLSLTYIIVGVLMCVTYIGRHHGLKCFMLAEYYVWPFGTFVTRARIDKSDGNGTWVDLLASALWFLFSPLLIIAHGLSALICWLFVVFIPMAKVNSFGIQFLFGSVKRLNLRHSIGHHDVVLFTLRAVNKTYYKYSISGLNVVFFNMLFVAIAVVVVGYSADEEWVTEYATPLFILTLLSTVPLAYCIGEAISRLAAQSSFVIGAVLNAFFGSIVEVILYWRALEKGLNDVVTQAITGSLVATLLFLPGLSMIAGGLKYKEQKFNKAAAGVSSVLLLLASVGTFLPTLIFSMYKNTTLSCGYCTHPPNSSGLSCTNCTEISNQGSNIGLEEHMIKPLSIAMAAILPIAYAVGLLFTMKTHAYLIDASEEGEGSGEEHPIGEWSKLKCVLVLLVATGLFTMLAELLTITITPAVDAMGISQSFAGLTFIAVATDIAEFLNAVQFAIKNDISLSLEIASSTAIQISFIQIPALLILCRILAIEFYLLFNTLNAVAVLFSVLIYNYLSIDGRSNYFEGFALVTLYIFVLVAFWFTETAT